MKVIGYEKYAFTPAGGTAVISGYTFYCVAPISDDRGRGLKLVNKLSLSNEKYAQKVNVHPDDLVGKEIDVLYNSYKKPEQITILK